MAEERRFDIEALNLMRLFEMITRARVRDVLVLEDMTPPRIIFVVDPGNVRKAVGKKGANIRALRERLGCDVIVVQFTDSPEDFIRSYFRAFTLISVTSKPVEDGSTMLEVVVAEEEKGRLIGKGGTNLDLARRLLARHHPKTQLRVL